MHSYHILPTSIGWLTANKNKTLPQQDLVGGVIFQLIFNG
jgi:hypothetical protein